jgi:hypothetical protein
MVYPNKIYIGRSSSQLGARSGCHHCNLDHLHIHLGGPSLRNIEYMHD